MKSVNVEEVGCGFAADLREADVWAEVQPKLGRLGTGATGTGDAATLQHAFFFIGFIQSTMDIPSGNLT